jgi:hypothetical protein
MDEAAIIEYINNTFEGIEPFTAPVGDTFFFYDPDHMMPLATLVTSDYNDTFSDLNRPEVFRLNIGVSKPTYESLFGPRPTPATLDEEWQSAYDFTAFDQVMPHPVYARMYWLCVLNPSPTTFETVVQPFLAEAYEMAVHKYAKRRADHSNPAPPDPE